jgi:shikimate dehydrogenase
MGVNPVATPPSPSAPGTSAPEEVDYVSGRTRLYGIFGDPIVQVRSPEVFTATFRRRGLDAVLVPMHVLPDDFDVCLRGVLALRNLDGLIFTIPYKARARALAASLGEQARTVGAINALARDGDRWKGEIFDGLGCVEAFRRRGIRLEGARIMLIGAGGAGSAVGVALAHQRPAFMRLHDLDGARAEALASKIRGVSPDTRIEIAAPRIDDVDVLFNVSPTGMLDDARLPLAVDTLPARLTVFDAVVKPERTPLLRLAESCGCTTVYGREMMRGQIDRMVDYFTGVSHEPATLSHDPGDA